MSNEVLGYASAAHVLYGQHATAAAAAAVPVVLLVAGGQPLTALVVAAASRVAMLFGFWWWRDVRAALLYTGLQRRWFEGVCRVWRLLVSALCLAELALCARLLAAANAAARTAAVQQAAMTAALAGFHPTRRLRRRHRACPARAGHGGRGGGAQRAARRCALLSARWRR